MKKKNLFLGIIVLLALASCSKDQAEPVTPNPGGETVTTQNVTYKNFGSAFFTGKCASCHSSGGSASNRWLFSGYSSVKDNSDRIKNAVLVAKSMPQGGSLTEAERSLLDAWFNRNLPQE